MKDILFFVGLVCWLIWLIDDIYFAVNDKSMLTNKFSRAIQFLAITLTILSWYIV